jgi:hypothetical protein
MIRHSGSNSKNERVQDWTENYEHKDNLEFFAAAIDQLTQEDAAHGGLMTIGLLGQRDLPGVTLRHAQSVLRWDLRPSLWSHAFLVARRLSEVAEIGELPIREVSIYSRTGTFPEPADNAVSDATLRVYADPQVDANVALLAVATSEEEVKNVADRAISNPNLDRLRYDFWETLGIWASYLWSGGLRPNPLREGFPMFSSAFVEYCYEGVPLDLSPAASERNSAPEHLWNGALWWDDAFTEFGHPISGYCCLRDKGGAILDPHVSAPAGTAR